MPDPMRIRASVKDGLADVRVLVAHEMETGLRKDAAGKTVPAWHITDLTATLNGQPALKARWGTAISKNPLLQFKLKGAKAGDKIVISWVDNRGETRSDEAIVTEVKAG